MVTQLRRSLPLSDFATVVRDHERIELAPDARTEMQASRRVIEEIIEKNDRRLYGVNTGFGDLYDVDIEPEDQRKLQENLLSEIITVGEPLSDEEVRAMMLARAAVLSAGRAGVRPVIVERILECLNKDVHPILGRDGNGNVGISGRIGAFLLGEGKANYRGSILPAEKALQEADIEPIALEPKDGLPLMDGPSLMTGRLVLAVLDAKRLIDSADIISALTFALMGKQPSAFSPRVIEERPHVGDRTSARIVRETLELTTETTSTIVQDPLSIRTVPQIHGTARESLQHALSVAKTELGGVGDNPLIFSDGTVASCGGFNGQHVSNVADSLRPALVKLGHGSERRTNLYIEGRGESPKFVAANPGVESGLERAHYSAASLVEEAASLGSASDRNIIVSAGQEDIHSMGSLATDHLRTTIDKIRSTLAIELLAAIRTYEIANPNVPDRAGLILEGLRERMAAEDLTGKVEELRNLIFDGTVTDLARSANVELPDLPE